MIIGESYYQFDQDQYDIISGLFGSEATDKLSYDSNYHIYYAAGDSDFADWLFEEEDALDILQAHGINTVCGPFSPNSGESGGN